MPHARLSGAGRPMKDQPKGNDMKLVTYSRMSDPRAGALLADGRVVDLHRASAAQAQTNGGAVWPDQRLPADMLALLDAGTAGLDAARSLLSWVEGQSGDALAALQASGAIMDADAVQLHAPIPKPRKVVAIGLNYKAHAAESGAELPPYPIVFAKATTCIVGPGEAVEVPRVSERVDWEGELCVVIGRRAHHVSREDALDYVAGYMNGNDVSVRDWQRHAATWMMGKSFDTHGPIGPWLVTADEAGDPASLTLTLSVNGVERQNSTVGDLIFDVPALIEYLSTGFTLEPGDIIFTGTPSGVGSAQKPQEWLKPGDTVTVAITRLGELTNPVVAEVAV